MGIVREFTQASNCGYFQMHLYQEDIVEYCETWYGSTCGRLVAMFAKSTTYFR
jgi:hypothetical protein